MRLVGAVGSLVLLKALTKSWVGVNCGLVILESASREADSAMFAHQLSYIDVSRRGALPGNIEDSKDS